MQLAFDLTEPLPPWTGSPLRFHTDYLSPDKHLEAYDRWISEHGILGASPRSGMWHTAMCASQFTTAAGHSFFLLLADARSHDHTYAPHHKSVPSTLLYQTICESCQWHDIAPSENAAVEAWHDHAFPGWRNLPVVPRNFTGKRRERWIRIHQPDAWTNDGAPIRTERQKGASRHVAGRSPFGGYDLGHVPHSTKDA